MIDLSSAYQQLMGEVKQIATLASVGSLLGWDERTQLPGKGVAFRSDQSAMIAGMVHERFTQKRIGDWLTAIEGEGTRVPDSDIGANVREIRRSYDRALKLPASLVQEMARVGVLAQQAWAEARERSAFSHFAPWLDQTLHLVRQVAACVGQPGKAYDALLDEYEPDETTQNLDRVFASLREPLVALVGAIGASSRKAPAHILERHYPADLQARLARQASKRVGFDFAAGRLDVSVHPFCSGIAPGDCRLTTRYDENYFGDAFFGVLHETGHGLYEQGLPTDHFGTPLGQAVSLGIHESQSRLWENFVGRSRAFWEYFYPQARHVFGAMLDDVSLDQWHFAVNDVRPSFIRTESDEATYNLHILLRYELEQALVTKNLAVADLPGAWDQRMQNYFGLTPPDDARGCLQDIHWSGAAFGYFPTYTLGNLYAAQFYERAKADINDLERHIAGGDFAPLLQWLRTNIHNHGKRYSAGELALRVTGKALSAEALLNHLRAKATDLYQVRV